MAKPSQLTRHIESFVDPSQLPTQQAASLDAIASLLKSDLLTIEALVREMGAYLTATDHTIRSRGVILLAELLTRLASKPLEDTTIHSLIGFFTDRLKDWKALHGALVGCLALMRRKSNAGMISSADAKVVAQSYLQHLQVQSLGQNDRKLCYELLECLFECYPEAVASMGDHFVYAVCEGMDGEKDPQCLMLTFHIVEVLAQLYPDLHGSVASFAGELFEILAGYFPIHFTHPKGEDADVKRDDLSRALMLAFSSTPLFEPYAVPLLLEKLSSSLPSAKIDSLKYLCYCTIKYGVDRMEKHARAVWSSLKDAIYTSQQEPYVSLSSESVDCLGFQTNDVATEALTLLRTVILQNNDLFLNLIVCDEDITLLFNSISSYKSQIDMPLQSKQKLYLVGHILSVCAKTHTASCNRVFENFFPPLMDALGLSSRNFSGDCFTDENYALSERPNFGALYLCVRLLTACRDLISSPEELVSESANAHEKWCCMLQSFSNSLTKAFSSTLATSVNEDAYDANIYLGVKGLQILATFSGGLFPISKSTFENILMRFMSIITVDFDKTLLWKLALKALVHIGSFVNRCHEPEKALSYMSIVVEKLVSLNSLGDFSLLVPLKLEAIADIAATGSNHMLKIFQRLEEAVSANLSDVYVHGNPNSAKLTVLLLECYSNMVLPWIHKTGGFEEVLLRFAVNIWNQIESGMNCSIRFQEKELLDATMKAMKLAVGNCSEEGQNIIVQKAFIVLSSNTSFPLKESMSIIVQVHSDGLPLDQNSETFSSRDEWILSLFASVIIAMRPQTRIPNIRVILHLFMETFLKGYVLAAQALGSIVNKMPSTANGAEIPSDCTFEEAIDIIFNTKFWKSHYNSSLKKCSEMSNDSDMGLANLCLGVVNNKLLQIHAITGLAWIGKGLLMRGHEKIKDVTMTFLECLLPKGGMVALPSGHASLEESCEQGVHYPVAKCAADAFKILMSDSEVCLNKTSHAIMRPLYKQRFFSTIMPILLPLIVKSDSSVLRSMLYRAFGHLITETPLIVILTEARRLIPILLGGLSMLSKDIMHKDLMHDLLLVISGILTDKNGQEAVIENAHVLINCLTELVAYPHMMIVRETAIQCLVAMSTLPHARIYPMRTQVVRAISKALADPKRAVRQEAVRCREAWASIASRSFRF